MESITFDGDFNSFTCYYFVVVFACSRYAADIEHAVRDDIADISAGKVITYAVISARLILTDYF